MVKYSFDMPKKTKKQKLRALERRKVELFQLNTSSSITTMSTATATATPPALPNRIEPVEQKTISYFFSDLKKSFFFIVCIIALEIVLYFARIRG